MCVRGTAFIDTQRDIQVPSEHLRFISHLLSLTLFACTLRVTISWAYHHSTLHLNLRQLMDFEPCTTLTYSTIWVSLGGTSALSLPKHYIDREVEYSFVQSYSFQLRATLSILSRMDTTGASVLGKRKTDPADGPMSAPATAFGSATCEVKKRRTEETGNVPSEASMASSWPLWILSLTPKH